MKLSLGLLLCFVLVATVAAREVGGPPGTVDEAVALASRLARATPSGGHAELAVLADRLAGVPSEWLVPCLAAFEGATPGGANWLGSGLDRAAGRLGDRVSGGSLAAVVRDTHAAPRARVLAFAWLRDRDAKLAESLLDGMLDDPSLDLRREAVERLLASAGGAGADAQKNIHRRALAAARDVDQVETIAAWLTEHGEPVDVAGALGFVRRWRVSGEFDNAKGTGFAKGYPPESVDGAAADTTDWKPVTSADKHGAVDLNAVVGTKKGVLAYAVAEVEMPKAGAAEVRIGSPCAIVVWVNGRRVMSHEIYHASEAIDQYVAAGEFNKGTNVVMVKCCQNEQTEPWAADWKFQLRICDPLGAALATQPVKGSP